MLSLMLGLDLLRCEVTRTSRATSAWLTFLRLFIHHFRVARQAEAQKKKALPNERAFLK